jgi:hypothetical protein
MFPGIAFVVVVLVPTITARVSAVRTVECRWPGDVAARDGVVNGMTSFVAFRPVITLAFAAGP